MLVKGGPGLWDTLYLDLFIHQMPTHLNGGLIWQLPSKPIKIPVHIISKADIHVNPLSTLQ